MSQISINISNLEEQIERLNALGQECLASQEAAPLLSGAGAAMEGVDALSGAFARIGESIAGLILDTASFFSDVKNSYEATDAAISLQFTSEKD